MEKKVRDKSPEVVIRSQKKEKLGGVQCLFRISTAMGFCLVVFIPVMSQPSGKPSLKNFLICQNAMRFTWGSVNSRQKLKVIAFRESNGLMAPM